MDLQIKMSHSVLVVEDNPDIARLVKLHLTDAGHQVDWAADGESALKQLESGDYDLVILDLMLPDMDGLDLCRQLRSRTDYIPILMLTSKSSELDRVLGLEMGADDYLTKPFSVMELVARVKAIFRRVELMHPVTTEPSQNPVYQIGDFVIDQHKHCVKLAGKTIDLTAREFDLLTHFAHHPGQVFSRAQLLDSVWGHYHDGYEHTVNSHINRLRAKIELNPADPHYLLTVWGVGYKFAEPQKATSMAS